MMVAVVRGSRDATAGLTLKYGASLKNSESQGLILRSAGAAHGLRPKDRKRINVPFGTGNAALSTALVPIAAGDPTAPIEQFYGRPRADFLAQLIATLAQAPQTCVRRRAEPDVAIAAYGARDRSSTQARHTLSRSL
jgi:hypothetical protein